MDKLDAYALYIFQEQEANIEHMNERCAQEYNSKYKNLSNA